MRKFSTAIVWLMLSRIIALKFIFTLKKDLNRIAGNMKQKHMEITNNIEYFFGINNQF